MEEYNEENQATIEDYIPVNYKVKIHTEGELPMKVLISFEKDGNGNYIASYKKQTIIILPGAFKRLTGTSDRSIAGSLYVEYTQLADLGFIKEPVVSITQEKNVNEMTVDELWSLLDREGIQIHSA